VELSDAELARRRKEEGAHRAAAFTPRDRKREVSLALKIYALLTSSADTGAVRRLPKER
jgi:dihydroxy-acid dehydratase